MIDRAVTRVLFAGLLFCFLGGAVHAQPANDECATATAVGEGSHPFDNTGSVVDGPSDGDGNMGADVWFLYTASGCGTATIETCLGGGTLDDTVLTVYDAANGCPVAGDAGIASNDDSCENVAGGSAFMSGVSIPVIPGNSYYVQVGGWNGGVFGTGTLTISVAGGPANDDCANATAVSDGTTPFCNTGAITDGPTDGDSNMGADVWFLYTPAADGIATIGTCLGGGTLDDTVLIAYDGAAGCPVAGDTGLAANDDSCENTAGGSAFMSEVSVAVTAGAPVLIQVGGWDGAEGSGALTISLAASAPEICGNNIDDDADGLLDCADPDCAADVYCTTCPTLLTQHVDPVTVDTNSPACAASPADHTDNGHFRSYDTSTLACPNGIRVLAMEVGIGNSVSAGGTGQPGAIRLWADPDGGAPDAGMVLLYEEILTIADGGPRLETYTLAAPVQCAANATVVAEFFQADSFFSGTGHTMRPGTNGAGEIAPVYLNASPCGLSFSPISGGPIINLVIDDQGAGEPGDNCAFALPAGEGATPFDNTGFTDSAEPNPTSCTNSFGQNIGDIWFVYTPTSDGAITVDTCDTASFDTDLSVYEGPCSALTLLGCDGDGAHQDAGCQDWASRVSNIAVLAGNTYYIRVAGWGAGEGGAGTLNIAFNSDPPVINEVRIDQLGLDNDEFFELVGTPQDLTGLTFLAIGDDAGGSSGVIEAVVDLTGSSIDSSGFFVAAESTFTIGTANLTTTLNFENSDNVTMLLVSGFTGLDGDDLDIDDDGVLDVEPWAEILDCVALIETFGSGDLVYCANQVGGDGLLPPPAVERCPDGFGDFFAGSDDATITDGDSPGAPNFCSTPPGNDECDGATEAFLGSNAIFTGNATDSADEFAQGGAAGCGASISKDVWYTFAPPADGEIVIDTCDLASWDTNVEVYSGSCAALAFIGGSCDTTGCGGFTGTTDPIPVSGGEVYTIRIGGFAGDPGGFGVFDISFKVAGDECTSATPVMDGANPIDTTLATTSSDPLPAIPCDGLGDMENDLWFTYTAAETGSISLSTCDPAGFDSDLAVYGGDCAALTELACNGDAASDPSCQSFHSQIDDLPVTAGETYTIRLGGWDASEGGAGTLTIDFALPIVPPTASISVGPLEGIAPLEVTLTDASYGGEDPAASLDIDWGDGTSDLGAGLGSTTTHTYMAGSWTPSATVTNAAGSDTATGPMILAIEMGDCNKDGSYDVADAIGLANYLFAGAAAPVCAGACDVNGDGSLDLADAVYSLIYLFDGGAAPAPAPGGGC